MPDACLSLINPLFSLTDFATFATAAPTDSVPTLNLPETSFGPFVNGLLAIPFVIVILISAKLAAWADKDAQANRLPREMINIISLASLALAGIVFFALPSFLLAFAGSVLILLLGGGIFLGIRNGKVGLGDLGEELSDYFGSLMPGSGKTTRKKKQEDETAIEGEVVLLDQAKMPVAVPEAEEPTRPGYVALQQVLAVPLQQGSERIDLLPGSSGAQVRYSVDGVAYPGATLSTDQATAAVTTLKRIIGLNVDERRKIQSGTLNARSVHGSHKIGVTTSGSTNGEQLKLEVDKHNRYGMKLDELGFRKSQLDRIRGQLSEPGVVLVACPPNNGLHTLLYGLLREHDAFLSHIQTLEREELSDLEGITQNRLQPGDSEAERVDWLVSQQSDVMMVEKLEDPQAARILADYGKDHIAYLGIRASSTFDAITRWRKFVGDDKVALGSLKMVVAGRVFRRLCPATKVPYTPDERALRSMGLSPDKVKQLYKAHVGPLTDAKGNEVPDTFCHGLGYKGRIGAYEAFLLDNEARKALISGASGQQIKSLFRKQNGRYIQEMALGIVQLGETDLQEVQRVMQSK
ncbi:MAG: ATPase, T2SS/T4P/T4SS family [Planctomycetota bacterium]